MQWRQASLRVVVVPATDRAHRDDGQAPQESDEGPASVEASVRRDSSLNG